MKTLFPIDVEAVNVASIPGLRLIAGYIKEPQERDLIAAIDAEVWDTSWKRRRQLYGKTYGRQDAPIRPIPAPVTTGSTESPRKNDRWYDYVTRRSRRLSVTFRRSKSLAAHRSVRPINTGRPTAAAACDRACCWARRASTACYWTSSTARR